MCKTKQEAEDALVALSTVHATNVESARLHGAMCDCLQVMEEASVVRAQAEELGLAEAIEAVRVQLGRAQDAGRGSNVRFAVGAVDVEFAVDVSKKAGGEASVKVLGLLGLASRGERSEGEAHRIRISLTPIGVGGQPFEVAASAPTRPDGSPTG